MAELDPAVHAFGWD